MFNMKRFARFANKLIVIVRARDFWKSIDNKDMFCLQDFQYN